MGGENVSNRKRYELMEFVDYSGLQGLSSLIGYGEEDKI